jgi:hypothetical protein
MVESDATTQDETSQQAIVNMGNGLIGFVILYYHYTMQHST